MRWTLLLLIICLFASCEYGKEMQASFEVVTLVKIDTVQRWEDDKLRLTFETRRHIQYTVLTQMGEYHHVGTCYRIILPQ